MSDSAIGPCLSATVITDRLDAVVAAWARYLDHQPGPEGPLPATTARRWQAPGLSGARSLWLHNALGEPWLRLVEEHTATPRAPFQIPGWQALEIAVNDVDALASRLEGSPFAVLGEPANLDVSEDLRAMQIQGPAGEVLYLTEIRDAVPGFELPRARCLVDRLFIPILLAPDRGDASSRYEALGGPVPLTFDTRIGVLNRARELPDELRHPVATLQLAGNNLIEIDELAGLPIGGAAPYSGITAIAFATRQTAGADGDESSYLGCGFDDDAPYSGQRVHSYRGAAGELFELIES